MMDLRNALTASKKAATSETEKKLESLNEVYKSGFMTVEEYLDRKKELERVLDEEEAKRIFAYFDLDGSGTIDRNELQGLIFELGEVMTQEEVNFIFNAIDTDHSGGISFEEFYTWWSNNDLDSNQKGERASFLKMKLQSKSYIRNIIAKSHKLSASMKSKPSKEKAAREGEEEESENVVINIKSTLGKYEQGEGHFGYAVDYDPSTCADLRGECELEEMDTAVVLKIKLMGNSEKVVIDEVLQLFMDNMFKEVGTPLPFTERHIMKEIDGTQYLYIVFTVVPEMGGMVGGILDACGLEKFHFGAVIGLESGASKFEFNLDVSQNALELLDEMNSGGAADETLKIFMPLLRTFHGADVHLRFRTIKALLEGFPELLVQMPFLANNDKPFSLENMQIALKQVADTILKAAVDAASTSGDYTFLQFYQGTMETFRELESVSFVAGNHLFRAKVDCPEFFQMFKAEIPDVPEGEKLELQEQVNACTDERKCTFLVTGPNFGLARQPFHLCSECNFTKTTNRILCEPCKAHCHANHHVEEVDQRGSALFKRSTGYCDCFLSGKCQLINRHDPNPVPLVNNLEVISYDAGDSAESVASISDAMALPMQIATRANHTASKSANCNLLLGSKNGLPMTLTHFVLTSAEAPALHHGIVHVFQDQPTESELTSLWNDLSLPTTTQGDSPTLFFTTDLHEKYLVVRLDRWVTGKYFFVKFISGFPGAGALVSKFNDHLNLRYAMGVCMDRNQNIYTSDYYEHIIQKIDIFGAKSIIGGVATQAGLSNGKVSNFNSPIGICVNDEGDVFVADYFNHQVRKIDHESGEASTLCGSANSQGGFQDDDNPRNVLLNGPYGLCVDPTPGQHHGDIILVDCLNNKIRRINATTGATSTIAGNGQNGDRDGDAASAQFSTPTGVCFTQDGNIIVSEYGANRLRKIDLTTNTVSTLFHKPMHPDAGIDDCHQPVGICCVGNEVIVCEYGCHRILSASLDTDEVRVKCIAGCGVAGDKQGLGLDVMLSSPIGICQSSQSPDELIITDASNHKLRILKLNPDEKELALTRPISFKYFGLFGFIGADVPQEYQDLDLGSFLKVVPQPPPRFEVVDLMDYSTLDNWNVKPTVIIFLNPERHYFKPEVHPHNLSVAHYDSGWRCDGKKIADTTCDILDENINEDTKRYRCMDCDFDFCQTCFDHFPKEDGHRFIIQFSRKSAWNELNLSSTSDLIIEAFYDDAGVVHGSNEYYGDIRAHTGRFTLDDNAFEIESRWNSEYGDEGRRYVGRKGENDIWIVENTIIGEASKMQMEAKVILKPARENKPDYSHLYELFRSFVENNDQKLTDLNYNYCFRVIESNAQNAKSFSAAFGKDQEGIFIRTPNAKNEYCHLAPQMCKDEESLWQFLEGFRNGTWPKCEAKKK